MKNKICPQCGIRFSTSKKNITCSSRCQVIRANDVDRIGRVRRKYSWAGKALKILEEMDHPNILYIDQAYCAGYEAACREFKTNLFNLNQNNS